MARLVQPADGFNYRLKDFSMMARGASVTALHGNDVAIPEATLGAMTKRLDQIGEGLYRVAVNEAPPASRALMQ